jgi:hypothetical protein
MDADFKLLRKKGGSGKRKHLKTTAVLLSCTDLL